MAFLDDIGTHLAAASTPTQALTVGTNLFLGRRPDTPDTCVTVYETGGTAPELIFGSNTAPPVETRGLQVVVRGASYATSEALCTEVWTALCLIDNEVIGTRRYLLADPVQSPFALDRDDRNRMLHVCNFLVSREVPTLPSKVGTVTATPGDAQVALSWTAPYAIGAITDYVVQYSTDDATWVTFADGTSAATNATVTGLVGGTLYYFRVAAVNSEGTGPYSDSVTATPISVPAQVGTVTPTAGDQQVGLAWSAPDDGGSPITDYSVQYSTDDATWSTFAHGTTATTATVTGLTNGTLYYFRVAAINAVGTGTYSASVTATPAGFSPLDLNPLIWLDASDTNTITESGGSVSQWDDKSSGTAYHLTQATGTAQPKTGTATINSLNVLEYDGLGTQFLENTVLPTNLNGPYTLFMVQEINSSNTTVIPAASKSNSAYGFIGSSGSSSTTINLAWGTLTLHVNNTLFTGTTRGQVWTAFTNAPAVARQSGIEAGGGATNGLRIGYGGGGANLGYGSKVAELFIVDSPTAQQITDAETYLADKWGITL